MSAVSQHLTVCVIVKNDETRISRAITSVALLGARVLVIDAFSEDTTFALAQAAWTEADRELADFEFLTKEYHDPVRSREESLALVKTRWVMWLDSDEWIEQDLHRWMLEHLEYLNFDNVYAFHRQSYFMNRALRHGGWYPDNCARLCRVGHAEWSAGSREMPVSEKLEPTSAAGQVVVIDAHLGHVPYQDLAEIHSVHQELEMELGAELAQHWHSVSQKPYKKWKQHLIVFRKFLEKFVLQKGFLDGSAGWVLAKSAALSLKWRIEKARDVYWIHVQ